MHFGLGPVYPYRVGILVWFIRLIGLQTKSGLVLIDMVRLKMSQL